MLLYNFVKRFARAILNRSTSVPEERRAQRSITPSELARKLQRALLVRDQATIDLLLRASIVVDPSDPEAHKAAGFARLASGEIDAAVEAFRAYERVHGSGDDVITAAFRCARFIYPEQRAGLPHFVEMTDVLVDTGHWTIMKDRSIYSKDTHGRTILRNPLVRRRTSADHRDVIVTYKRPTHLLAEPCIFVGGDENYSHWLHRNLIKLVSVDQAGLLYRHPWLINSDLKGYQREYLDLLNAERAGVTMVPRNEVIACKRVIVPTVLVQDEALKQGVQWLREKLALPIRSAGRANRLLYVSRQDAGRRKLLNEDEVYARLAPQGFERVIPSELSAWDQVRTFAEARIIVAPHGAGLTNLIFAPQSAAIIEITSVAIEQVDIFRRLARCMGQRVTKITSTDLVHDTTTPMHSDYRVNPDIVVQAVRKYL